MVALKEIMTANVYTIERSETIHRAAVKMKNMGISCLMITEASKPVGIITRRDILEKILAEKQDPDSVTVEETMTSPVVKMDETSSLIVASAVMNKKKIKQLPVVNNDGDMRGIITQTDIIRNIDEIFGFSDTDVNINV